MTTSRLERLAPLTGAASMLLIIGGALLFDFYEYLPAAGDIQQHITDNADATAVAAAFGVLGAFLILWFAGSVRVFLRRAEGGDGRLSAVAFGGGVAASAGLFLVYGLMYTMAARAGESDTGLSEFQAVTTYDIYATLFTVAFGGGLAVMIAAFSVVSLRKGLGSGWFAWLGLVIAVGSVTPLAYIFIAAVVGWVIVVSVWLYRLTASAEPSSAGMNAY